MNWRNVTPDAWLLCLEWVADVMNHSAEESLGWKPPLQILTGQTIDISILLYFMFWDIVYVSRSKDAKYNREIGSEKSSEIRGRFVGFAWSVGHAITFKVLTNDTKRIICRSKVRLSKDRDNNLMLDAQAGDNPERTFIYSKRDGEGDDLVLPTIDINDTKGWQDPKEYGTYEPMPDLLERNRDDTAPKDGEPQSSAKDPGENTPHAKKHGETVHLPTPDPKKIQKAA